MDLKGLDKEFWTSKYENNLTGCDMGEVSPPIAHYINQIEDKSLKILIPGAGNAHEAVYLLENGFTDVTVIDISHKPIQKLKNQFPNSPHLHLIEGNFFEHEGKYDLIIEQTFFCAIHPSLRRDYALKMKDLLAKNGKLVGLLFEWDKPDGPPFGGNSQEYLDYFGDLFTIKTMEPCYNSHPARQGRELWINLQ